MFEYLRRTVPPEAAAAVLMLALALARCASSAPASAARDRFPLDPREGLAGPFHPALASGWRALEAGDAAGARREFEKADGEGSRRAAAIGTIEALVLLKRPEDAEPLCTRELSQPQGTPPLWTACGERAALVGDAAGGFELYERAADRSPQRRGIARRTEELRGLATDAILSAAERDASAGRRGDAGAKVAQALAWNPGTPSVLMRAAEVECAAGEKETALRYYRDALALGGVDDDGQRRAAELALENGDYAMAVSVFESLAAGNPSPELRERAAEARLAFRIDNWPDAERQAAHVRRLTRSGAALLVSWMFPELREGRVQSGVVAGDVLERRDSRVMIRAVALGLLDVDPDTHRARPDAPLSRGAAAQLLLRLAVVLGKPGAPSGCLAPAAEASRTGGDAIRLAARCGLLSESGGTYVSGAEMTRGLDRLRSSSAFGEARRD